MKFQTGDHVLWNGLRAVVTVVGFNPSHAFTEYEKIDVCVECEDDSMWWLSNEKLLSHQRSWSFDKTLNGWVPA